MSENPNKELTTGESLKETKYVLKWISVLIIMGVINLILGKSYGPLKENFFSVDLSNRFLSAKKLMIIFTLLMFSIIYGVREWTRMKQFSGTTQEERKEEFTDFMVYIIISLATFLYASAYIRRKFNTGGGTQSGGADEGILKNTVSSVSSTGFGTLTLYVGILVIILNVITNTFQYLRNKRKNQKDKLLRSIYFGQISTMLQFLVACFFVIGFGMGTLREKKATKIAYTLLKWGLLVAFCVTGIHMINEATDFENWFGEPKAEAASNKNNPNLNATRDQSIEDELEDELRQETGLSPVP